jgi:hypothetical protein
VLLDGFLHEVGDLDSTLSWLHRMGGEAVALMSQSVELTMRMTSHSLFFTSC